MTNTINLMDLCRRIKIVEQDIIYHTLKSWININTKSEKEYIVYQKTIYLKLQYN